MSKQHKNMDRTSAAMAKALDALRERNKKRAVARKKKAGFDRTSLSRGGFRC